MAKHFKLVISPKYTKVITFTGVKEDFADEYAELLSYGRIGKDDDGNLKDDEFDERFKKIFQLKENDKDSASETSSSPSTKPKKKIKKKPKYDEPDPNTFEGKYTLYNYRKRIKERSAKFRAYAFINFTKGSTHFATLTFDPATFPGADDLDVAHDAFRKFVKRVQGKYTDFKYAGTFSRQKQTNSWHYHMFFNFDGTVTTKDIEEMWQYGFVSSTFITSNDELYSKISYCIDNMFKVSYSDLKGEKGYLRSKNLQDQLVLRSWNKKESAKAYELLHELLQKGEDKPTPQHSVMLEKGETFFTRLGSPDGTPMEVKEEDKQITYLVSNKGFPELFDKPIVAKRKALKRAVKE